MPTEYELVSSDLHYNYPYNFELGSGNPVVEWVHRHREGSRLQAGDWGTFADPRATTYRSYTELQDDKETVVDGLLREIDETGYDERLPDDWVRFLHRWYAPLRYPAHGLAMLAAYVGQMAPDSRITNCASFQAADAMRGVQRIAYRTAQLGAHRSGVDTEEHRAFWEDSDALQPLRELVERALVAYDWGEALVALNVVVKPRLDRLVNRELFGDLAHLNGDPVLRDIHFSLDEDAMWHRDWTEALLSFAVRDTPHNAGVVGEWVDAWTPLATEAVKRLAGVADLAPIALEPGAMSQRVNDAAEADVSRMLARAEQG